MHCSKQEVVIVTIMMRTKKGRTDFDLPGLYLLREKYF